MRRQRGGAKARGMVLRCWELRRRRLDLSYDQIAAALNRVNHATALHSFTTFCEYVKRGRFAAERAAVAKLLGDET